MAGRQYWSAPIGPLHVAAGVSYNTSVTKTDISPGAATNPIWIPAGTLDLGTVLEIDAFGTVATSATTPTFTWDIMYGAVGGVSLGVSAALTIPNTATVNWPWRLHYEGMIYATGNGTIGQIEGCGWVDVAATINTFTHNAIPTGAQAAIGLDTTISKAITIAGTWGTSAAANIAFCRYMSVQTRS